MRLTISRDFFTQFAKRTWPTPYSVVAELVEDSYDEDSTRVIVTVADDYVVVEDDAGMDSRAVERFLTVGSTHKQLEPTSPRFRRARTGRYGVGRLSFLASFGALKVKTRKGDFSACFVIDEGCLADLAAGEAEVKTIDEPPLERDGSEIWLLQPRGRVNPAKILEGLRELPILREPFFEVWLRIGQFKPWSLEGAERVKPREVVGEKIPFELEGGVTGEVTVAYRPLTDREKGILIMYGGHAVARSTFGLPPSEFSRITGWVKCDWITVRFADKAAVIEDEAYERLQNIVRRFLTENVIPKATQVEKGMTYEESRIFMEVDRLLSKTIMMEKSGEVAPDAELPKPADELGSATQQPTAQPAAQTAPEPAQLQPPSAPPAAPSAVTESPAPVEPPRVALPTQLTIEKPETSRTTKPFRREVYLTRLGLKVVPYDDEGDEREFFTEGSIIYVNRGHPAYRKELKSGREVLRRHILRIVASALASSEYPDSRALEYANRLIAEAIKHF